MFVCLFVFIFLIFFARRPAMLGLMGFSGSLPLYVIHLYYIFVFIDRANKDACLLASHQFLIGSLTWSGHDSTRRKTKTGQNIRPLSFVEDIKHTKHVHSAEQNGFVSRRSID